MPSCVVRMFRALQRVAPLVVPLATGAATAADLSGPMSSSPAASTASAAASAGAGQPNFDVQKLFANTCGWCHSGAGRVAGKGPQLMSTTLTDEQIVYRIRNGKQGAMPAFGSSFNDDQIKGIVKYIRDLKPEGATQ